ncbi:hypothetical protein chiPu_0002822 [Chiloscyllium punctatum]|uniref:Uncharacterized protein n=1 Tax=Chiloscyllium punctatum TaxID=137246 RepID=A0A401S1Y3_CHIPU|nr:hypothetical protein [Chiloscyllium punctatum]
MDLFLLPLPRYPRGRAGALGCSSTTFIHPLQCLMESIFDGCNIRCKRKIDMSCQASPRQSKKAEICARTK